MPRPRDSRGRFVKKAKPALLDPALVKSLGSNRPSYEMTLDQQWKLDIIDEREWRKRLKGEREQGQDTKAAQTEKENTS